MATRGLVETLEGAPEGARLVKGEDLKSGDVVKHPNGKMACIIRQVPDNGPEYFVYFNTTEGDFWMGRCAHKVVYP